MENLEQIVQQLKSKIEAKEPVKIMIIGLGSVGLYLLDYLVNLADPQIEIIVTGRDKNKMVKDVNIIKTAATIRNTYRSKIYIEANCDLENIETIALAISKHQPDFIVNSSRVYSGLKYGSISWHNLRAYGIWTPLSIRYARNIMAGYSQANSHAITINTSYSDAVIPWLKSAKKAYYHFGSGNLNHLIPRIKFYIADKYKIENLNEIDVTIATSHFHDVVISKEGHSEGQDILLNIKYKGQMLDVDKSEAFKACMIDMPVDQKRNMMNASSNFNIIFSILDSIKSKKLIKLHSPGVDGEIGGYPVIIDGTSNYVKIYFDTSVFSIEEMREANKKSIYLDGIENVKDGCLIYTDELVQKLENTFEAKIPKTVCFDRIEEISNFLITNVIHRKIN